MRLIFQYNPLISVCVITSHNHPVPLIIHLTLDPTRCNGPVWKLVLSAWDLTAQTLTSVNTENDNKQP